jgi:hypothetical protein
VALQQLLLLPLLLRLRQLQPQLLAARPGLTAHSFLQQQQQQHPRRAWPSAAAQLCRRVGSQ